MRDTWREINLFLSRYLSPAVRAILVANVIIFLLYALLGRFRPFTIFFFLLWESPRLAVGHLFLWQFVTYMFMHAGPAHLFFNMLVLWFFAPRLEYRWGTARFLRFYFVVGIGAGVFHALFAYLTHNADSSMMGASGAIYGVMLAYAIYYPDETVLFYFVLPIKIKYLMIILGVITFFASIPGDAQGGISHVTHLGGLVVAFLYLQIGNWLSSREGRRGSGRRFDL